jgi:Ser/Thr protein kinase RdoA (MazF antagonist)
VDASITPAAIAASQQVATRHGLPVERAVVLQDSNRLTVHIQPCDVIARVATQSARTGAELEVALAEQLAATAAPVAPLDPRVEPQVFDEGEFAITLWAYCRPVPPSALGASEYADGLARLHQGMRAADAVPALGHFMDRVAEAQGLVEDPANESPISPDDRDLVRTTLRDGSRAVLARASSEQLLHGEPHPGNMIRSDTGLVFVDLETCCRGPVEFDIAHATIVEGTPPTEVARLYPGADVQLVRECWRLTLALAIAWRFEPGDDLPDGTARARSWARKLRTGPSTV